MRRAFVSHSTADDRYVAEMESFLRAAGYDEVFNDVRSIAPDAALWPAIEKGIADANTLVVVITTASTASAWVTREVELARRLSKDIIPVWIQDCPVPPIFADRDVIDFRPLTRKERPIDISHIVKSTPAELSGGDGGRDGACLCGDIKLSDGSWLIERRAELDALKHLLKLRVTVALQGGRQLGKTLRAHRIAQRMLVEGWQSVNVDLRDEFADDDYTRGHGFLRRLAEKITDQTNSDRRLLDVFDRDGTPTAFKTHLDAIKLSRPGYRLLLRLDRIDAIAGRPCCSAVLSGLRIIHNTQRALDKQAWLQMLLIYTVTPRQTGGSFGSILDVAKVIEIPDFSKGELQKLATLYELSGLDISKMHSFLGGHPALSELTFEAIRENDEKLDQIVADSKAGGIFKQHLDRLTKEFRDLPSAKQLAQSFRALVMGMPLDSEESFDALLALGVVKGTYSGDAEVRCELYKTWLPPRLPK